MAWAASPGYMVEMLQAGCFEALLDVQCFDLRAVECIRSEPAAPGECPRPTTPAPAARSSSGGFSLDVVILGATEIDTEFSVNVHTDSATAISWAAAADTAIQRQAPNWP